jgi:hypothetical protein
MRRGNRRHRAKPLSLRPGNKRCRGVVSPVETGSLCGIRPNVALKRHTTQVEN